LSQQYQLTEKAEEDLLAIWLYVDEEFGTATADRVFTQLVEAFELLASQPEIGEVKPVYAPAPYRCWVVGPSIIAYLGISSPIQIARIVRAERDWREVDI